MSGPQGFQDLLFGLFVVVVIPEGCSRESIFTVGVLF